MVPILKNRNMEVLHFLKDCISCEVTEERNGVYELTMTYPVKGRGYADLKESHLIFAKPNDTSENQLFSIYEISKPISGIVTVKAEHISYATSHYPIVSLDADGVSASSALALLTGKAVGNADFIHVSSDIATLRNISYKACSLRAAFGGVEGSLLDLYGGEFEFDNQKTILHKNRGTDTGVIISYGKNLTELKCTTSKENSYTAIFPYYLKDDVYITLAEEIISVENKSDIEERILLRDFTSEFSDEEIPTEELLRSKTNDWLDENDINSLSINLIVGFQHLWQSPEYKDIQALEKVSLCDTVNVWHKILNVFIKAKVIKTVYDVLAEKYRKIELGDARANFSSTLQDTQKLFESKIKESQKNSYSKITAEYEKAIKNATNKITGFSGGYVVLDPSENPQRLLVMNTPSASTATKVWQWNINGLGYSSNGIDGPYKTAITMDGQIVADFITVGSLTANIIKAGILKSADGKSYFNLDSGVICTNQAYIDGGYVKIGDEDYRTEIIKGSVEQYLLSNTTDSTTATLVGGLTPIGIKGEYINQGLYCGALSNGVAIYKKDTETGNTFTELAFFSTNNNTYLRGYVETYSENDADQYSGLRHRRTKKFDGTNKKTYKAMFGIGSKSTHGIGASASMQIMNDAATVCYARLDAFQPSGEAVVLLQGYSDSKGWSSALELGTSTLYWGGTVVAVSSTENIKEDIRDTSDVLNLFESSKIYTYKYKQSVSSDNGVYDVVEEEMQNNGTSGSGIDASSGETENTNSEEKDSLGFVIGRETPDAVITADGKHIDLYSMAAICWKGIQELSFKISNLESELLTLKGG